MYKLIFKGFNYSSKSIQIKILDLIFQILMEVCTPYFMGKEL